MSTHEYPHPFDFQGSIKLGQTAVEKRRHQVNKGPDSLSVLCPPPLSISAFLGTHFPQYQQIEKGKQCPLHFQATSLHIHYRYKYIDIHAHIDGWMGAGRAIR